MNIKIISALLISAIVLIGCGTSNTMVLEPVQFQKSIKTVQVKQIKNTVAVSNQSNKKFAEFLNESLYKGDELKKGSDLILEYRFVQFNEGSRFTRYMTGGFGTTGEAKLTVQVIYKNSQGKQIGKIQTEGKIGAGFFGGSFDEALKSAAKDVAEYTKSVIRTKA